MKNALTITKAFCFAFLAMAKINAQTVTFSKTFDYQQNGDFPFHILSVSDSIYLTLTGSLDFNTEGNSILLSRFDLNGNLLSNKNTTPPAGFSYYTGLPGSFIKTNDGGFACGGSLQNDSSYLSQLILIKYNSMGDTEWIKKFSYSGYDFGYGCIQTSDNGFAIIGETVIGFIHHQVYLIKTDSSGNLLWRKLMGN